MIDEKNAYYKHYSAHYGVLFIGMPFEPYFKYELPEMQRKQQYKINPKTAVIKRRNKPSIVINVSIFIFFSPCFALISYRATISRLSR